MRRATRHSYLTKARDDFGVAFFITLCGRHLPEDSASALWIEDFEVLWENQERSDLCLHCATEMRLEGAN
ncbi:MAG: hypothetical protein F4X65_01450 [Chloroflexi bacterium]|nr:hypothetical protein [Chloroflexota bacterium]